MVTDTVFLSMIHSHDNICPLHRQNNLVVQVNKKDLAFQSPAQLRGVK